MNSVDVLLAMNVVYFLSPLSKYAAEFKRILKKGSGRGILGCKPNSIKTANEYVFKNKSIHLIKEALEASGLEVREEFVDLGNPVESYVALHIKSNN
jgi:nucleotide-binding universal stress UspA family protein